MSRDEGNAARNDRATPSPADGLGPEYRPDMKIVSFITVPRGAADCLSPAALPGARAILTRVGNRAARWTFDTTGAGSVPETITQMKSQLGDRFRDRALSEVGASRSIGV